MEKIFETDSFEKFLCEIAYYGKGSVSIFEEFCGSIDKIFILDGELGARLYFYEILRFS